MSEEYDTATYQRAAVYGSGVVVAVIIAMDNMYRTGILEAPEPSMFWWGLVAIAYGAVGLVILQWILRGGYHVP